MLRVLISDKVKQGHPFAPMHWTDCTSSNSRVNTLVAPTIDPYSGQPALKGSEVWLQKYDAIWYGFLVSKNQLVPKTEYAAIAKTATGWSAEIADSRLPAEWESLARDLLDLSNCSAVAYEDAAKGNARIGFWQEDILVASMFVAAEPISASRTHVVEQVGKKISPLRFFPGRPENNAVDKGAIVCSCFGVGVNTIRQAISAGARNTTDLGRSLCAGTNCGSCLPELKAIFVEANPRAIGAE